MLPKLLTISLTTMAIGGITGLAGGDAVASPSIVSIDVFHDELSPHGDWVMVPAWGEVWRPNVAIVGGDFTPYVTHGEWVSSEYGWVFESRFNWGWAPFHYGRWAEDGRYGWVWVPDEEWGPAWVDWRVGGGYVGWAPSSPRGSHHHEPRWAFVETRNFVEPNVVRFVLPRPRIQVAFTASAPVTHRVVVRGRGYVEGPAVRHVETAIGRSTRRVAIVPPRRASGPAVVRRSGERGQGIDSDRRDDDDDDRKGNRRSKGNGRSKGTKSDRSSRP